MEVLVVEGQKKPGQNSVKKTKTLPVLPLIGSLQDRVT